MFTLSTDTSCDILRGKLDEQKVAWTPLSFTIKEQTIFDDFDADARYTEFYNTIRAGAMPVTSQINAFLHEEHFEKLIEQGASDIIHLTLSGGLSATYNSAVSGAAASMERHSGIKIYILDTLAATQGHRAILDQAVIMRDCSMPAKDAFKELEIIRSQLHHWIIVDDLMHLKRGGRVSGAAAYIGSLLNLKPILIINDEGKLAVVHKSKGTVKAMAYLMEMLDRYGDDINNQTIYLASADASDKAVALEKLLKEKYTSKVTTGWIGPVIGAHTGPGTLGLVFRAKTNGRLNNK